LAILLLLRVSVGEVAKHQGIDLDLGGATTQM
jgi:hypothetical protein